MSIPSPDAVEVKLAPAFSQLHLRLIDLGDTRNVPDFLLAVMEGSRHTLSRLQLRNVWLIGGRTWLDLADQCSRNFKLRHVILLGLNSDGDYSRTGNFTLDYEATVEVARRMLQWADPRALITGLVDTLNQAVDARVDPEKLVFFERQKAGLDAERATELDDY